MYPNNHKGVHFSKIKIHPGVPQVPGVHHLMNCGVLQGESFKRLARQAWNARNAEDPRNAKDRKHLQSTETTVNRHNSQTKHQALSKGQPRSQDAQHQPAALSPCPMKHTAGRAPLRLRFSMSLQSSRPRPEQSPKRSSWRMQCATSPRRYAAASHGRSSPRRRYEHA